MRRQKIVKRVLKYLRECLHSAAVHENRPINIVVILLVIFGTGHSFSKKLDR